MHESNRCRQHWLSKWAKETKAFGEFQLHQKVRGYLSLDTEAEVVEERLYKKRSVTSHRNETDLICDLSIDVSSSNDGAVANPEASGGDPEPSSKRMKMGRENEDPNTNEVKVPTHFTNTVSSVSSDEDLDKSTKEVMVESICKFLESNHNHGNKDVADAKRLMMSACTAFLPPEVKKEDVRQALGVSSRMFYDTLKHNKSTNVASYSHKETKATDSPLANLQRSSVKDFCHHDEGSAIDSNSTRKAVEVDDGEKHVPRAWLAKTCDEQYALFKQSATVEQYKATHENYKVPSRSFFLENRCPCVGLPTMQSCVNLRVSSLMHYARALAKFIRNNKDVKEALEKCDCEQHQLPKEQQWQTYLNGRVERMVEATCCQKVQQPLLKQGAGTYEKTPALIPWECANSTCSSCGVEKKFKISKCKILNEQMAVVDCLEWIDAPRQGHKKNGKQNTQIELGLSKLTVKSIVQKFIDQLIECRLHQAQYEWRNTMRQIDLTMLDPDKFRVTCTDVGATLDLMAAEKDNSSVNNHAVICILFVIYNWRKVEMVKKVNGKEVKDETIVNDCDKWIIFGDT